MEKNKVQVIWGTPILDNGFANVPNMLIRNYRKLGITHGEFGLIMQLISYKHDEGNPFPSQETLANNLDSSPRAIRKLIAGLEDKELIEIEYQYMNGHRTSNIYILKPLIDKCLKLYGESRLPDEKPKRKSYRKVKKPEENLEEPKVPVLAEPKVPQLAEPRVPVLAVPQVPTNITREYNKDNITKEYNNLSITEGDIEKLDLHISIQKQMIINKKRLIDDSIDIYQIENIFKAYERNVSVFEFSLILGNVLKSTRGKIKNINSIMMIAIKNHFKDQERPANEEPVSNEVIPDWFKDRNKPKDDYSDYDFTKNHDWVEDKELSESLKTFKEILEGSEIDG